MMLYTIYVIVDYFFDPARECGKLLAMIVIEIVAVGLFFRGIWVTLQAVMSRKLTDERLNKLMEETHGTVKDIQIPKQNS